MASNTKTYEKKLKKIEKSIIKDEKIIEAISKGGKLEIKIKDECIEFWRKGKGEEKKLVSALEKISNNMKCLRWYSEIVLGLIDKHASDKHASPDYRVSLTINYPYRKPTKYI